jgi:hypothetical protein
MSQTLQSIIADLLSQAGSAHHHYEQTELKGVYDQNWAAWYAEYVIDQGLNEVLSQPVTVDQLGQFLRDASQLYKEANTDLNWAEFTAVEFVEQFA